MARGTDHERSIDRVRIHAGVVIVVEGDERPVRNHASDTDGFGVRVCCGAGNEIFDAGGVEEFHVREGDDFGEEGGHEEGGVLDDYELGVGWVFFVGDAKVLEEAFRGFAEDHGGEELPAEPAAAACECGISVAVFSSMCGADVPGETEASMIAIFKSGRAFPST